MEFNRAVGKRFSDDVAGEIGDAELEWIAMDRDAKFRGFEADGGARVFSGDSDGGGAGGRKDGPGGIFRELAGRADAHTQDIIAQSGDLHDGGAGVDFDSVGGCPGSGDPVESHEA